MNKILSSIVVLGFLFVDFLFFHDMFKPGEVITVAQYLTGLLSVPVILMALKSLVQTAKPTKA